MRVMGTCVMAAALLLAAVSPAAAQADTALNVRVSIDFKNAAAPDVLKSLASAASVQAVIPDEELSPVTVTLTNVRLRTALDAVCENAGCSWQILDGKPPIVRVTRTGARSNLALKTDVSVHLQGALFEQAFRMLGSYLDVRIAFEGKLPVKSVTLTVTEATTVNVLDALCKAANCTWRFEPEHRRLVVSAK